MLGERLEREIREQPQVWRRVAQGDAASRLAAAVEGDVVLLGSGSSLFAAQLGALAFRRRSFAAHALAASEALRDNVAYRGSVAIAISQSGRSTDVLRALDALQPRRIVALTNDALSPLADRADVTIDVGAGRESAIPATKSVTATVAILLAAATLRGGNPARSARALDETADTVDAWLRDGAAMNDMHQAASQLAARHDVMFLGTDYGAPVAREAALKFKEATYLHAEGFAAGEFRHGSAAMLDASSALVGILDQDGREIVARALGEAAASGALRFTIGADIESIVRLGPIVDDAYNTLAWLVTVQVLALFVARLRDVDSDAPRGLTKAIVSE